MPKFTTHTEKLKGATVAEKSEVHSRAERYKALRANTAAHQVSFGLAPNEEEFTQWLADVKHAVNLKKMMVSG